MGAAATLGTSCSYELLELQPELPANAQSSIIYASDGTEIVTLHAEENRTDLTLDEIPDTAPTTTEFRKIEAGIGASIASSSHNWKGN